MESNVLQKGQEFFLKRLIKDVRNVEKSLGKPVKIIYPEEKVIMSKLRKYL